MYGNHQMLLHSQLLSIPSIQHSSFVIHHSLSLLVQYCRLSATVTSLCSAPQAGSSVERLGPIRDARPGNLAGMHAIGEVFGQNNPGTDAGKRRWLIRSVFKEE
jgi:hypothetical protein